MDFRSKQDALEKLRGLSFEDDRQALLEKLRALAGQQQDTFGTQPDATIINIKEEMAPGSTTSMTDEEKLRELLRQRG